MSRARLEEYEMPKQIAVRMPRDLYMSLQRAASVAGTYPSEVVREILTQELPTFIKEKEKEREERQKRAKSEYVENVLDVLRSKGLITAAEIADPNDKDTQEVIKLLNRLLSKREEFPNAVDDLHKIMNKKKRASKTE